MAFGPQVRRWQKIDNYLIDGSIMIDDQLSITTTTFIRRPGKLQQIQSKNTAPTK